MDKIRTHAAVSDDGTEIVGRVRGDGPAVVLVHGSVADGESEWASMVPLLEERFTCYTPSLAGRGDSGSRPEPSRTGAVQDVAAYADSIAGPTALIGVSYGGMAVLGAAARTKGVVAVAAYEPIIFDVIDDETSRRVGAAIDSLADEIEAGRPEIGVESFFGLIANEAEVEALSQDPQGVDPLIPYLPTDVAEIREALEFAGPSPTSEESLGRLEAPVIFMYGSETALPWFAAGARHAAQHVPGANLSEVVGTGHMGHHLNPSALADEIVPLLEQAF